MMKEILVDKEMWRFFNTFAPWFSAIGTFLAVATSLYLATKDRKPRLKVVFDLCSIIQYGQKLSDGTRVVSITVTSRNVLPVHVTGFLIRLGLFKKEYAYLVSASMVDSSPLPTKLEYGQQAQYNFPEKYFEDNATTFRSMLRRFFKTAKLKNMRLCVTTTLGSSVIVRPEYTLKKWFTDLIKDGKKKEHA